MNDNAGLGADDLRGGPGSDRLSYLPNDSGVSVSLDGQAGDGSANEGDNVHGDVEIVIGSTFDDVLTGNGAAQQLFGNAGADRVDGLGGDDLLNGGTGDDELYGGAGRDRLEGSAGSDYLEGGSGDDIFEGDNVCTESPCSGDSDFIQARDGEADTVNCGVGADTALVDDIDVVALDAQHGCERVERAATVAQGGGLDETAAGAGVPKLRVVGVRKLRTLRRGKFRIEVTCPDSCRVKARLIAGRTVVARRTRTHLGAGKLVLRPKTSKKGRKTLARRKRVRLTLAVDVDERPGQRHHARPGAHLPPLAFSHAERRSRRRAAGAGVVSGGQGGERVRGPAAGDGGVRGPDRPAAVGARPRPPRAERERRQGAAAGRVPAPAFRARAGAHARGAPDPHADGALVEQPRRLGGRHAARAGEDRPRRAPGGHAALPPRSRRSGAAR